jgi:hypothetical protein
MNYQRLHKRKMENAIREWEIAGQHLIEELRLTSLIPTSDDRARIVDVFNKIFSQTYKIVLKQQI